MTPPRERGRTLAFGLALALALATPALGSCSFVMDFGRDPGEYGAVYEPIACLAQIPGTNDIPDQEDVLFATIGVRSDCAYDLAGVQVLVTDLRNGWTVLNADGAPEGEGAHITIDPIFFGEDHLLNPGEVASVTFQIRRGDTMPAVLLFEVWGRLPLPE